MVCRLLLICVTIKCIIIWLNCRNVSNDSVDNYDTSMLFLCRDSLNLIQDIKLSLDEWIIMTLQLFKRLGFSWVKKTCSSTQAALKVFSIFKQPMPQSHNSCCKSVIHDQCSSGSLKTIWNYNINVISLFIIFIVITISLYRVEGGVNTDNCLLHLERPHCSILFSVNIIITNSVPILFIVKIIWHMHIFIRKMKSVNITPHFISFLASPWRLTKCRIHPSGKTVQFTSSMIFSSVVNLSFS